MAIVGLDHFAEFFRGYEDCYTVIGGTACEILMSEYSTRTFRATKDVDMIVLMEDRSIVVQSSKRNSNRNILHRYARK